MPTLSPALQRRMLPENRDNILQEWSYKIDSQMPERLTHALKWEKTHAHIVAETKAREMRINSTQKAAYIKKRRATDLQFKVRETLRSRIGAALRMRAKKAAKSADLLGCSIPELMRWIEGQFTEGMTWENYGQWHIDHKRPCASFNLLDPQEQRKCFHYRNLQPLWAVENHRKSDRFCPFDVLAWEIEMMGGEPRKKKRPTLRRKCPWVTS